MEDDPGWLALYKVLLGADISIIRRLQRPDSPVETIAGQPSIKGRKPA